MGKVDQKSFEDVCFQKFLRDEAEMRAMELSSLWKDQVFAGVVTAISAVLRHSLLVVAVVGGTHKNISKKLQKLEATIEVAIKMMEEIWQMKVQEFEEESVNPFVWQKGMEENASKSSDNQGKVKLKLCCPMVEEAGIIKSIQECDQLLDVEPIYDGRPVYDEERGYSQEFWLEQEFILAALDEGDADEEYIKSGITEESKEESNMKLRSSGLVLGPMSKIVGSYKVGKK
ncbi:hypothetical protein AgCh_001972 [Apium graveolens]